MLPDGALPHFETPWHQIALYRKGTRCLARCSAGHTYTRWCLLRPNSHWRRDPYSRHYARRVLSSAARRLRHLRRPRPPAPQPTPPDAKSAEPYRFPEELLNAQIRFWVCTSPGHRNVQWREDVAYCTTPGCGRTSADPPTFTETEINFTGHNNATVHMSMRRRRGDTIDGGDYLTAAIDVNNEDHDIAIVLGPRDIDRLADWLDLRNDYTRP